MQLAPGGTPADSPIWPRPIAKAAGQVAASTVPNSVEPELEERLRKHWDDGEIVELLGVVALFGYLNRWNDSMGTTIEPGAEQSGRRWLARDSWDPGKHR